MSTPRSGGRARRRAQGRVAIWDVGSYRDGTFLTRLTIRRRSRLSEDPDWPGEWFLDIRECSSQGSVLAGILNKLFQMCKDKGFTPSEPDNLDNGSEPARHPGTEQDQVDFDGWVANRVATRWGISVRAQELARTR